SQLDQFDIVIRRKHSTAVAAVPQLGLYAKAENIQAAIELLDKRKLELLQDLEMGAIDLDLITRPGGDPSRRTYMQAAVEFAVKTSIVAVIIAAATVLAGTLLAAQTNKVIQNAKAVGLELTSTATNMRIGGRQFWTGV